MLSRYPFLVALACLPALGWQSGVVPSSAVSGSTSAAVQNDVATLSYAGADGTLQYRWQRPQRGSDPLLGSIVLTAKPASGPAATVALGLDATGGWTGTAQWQSSRWDTSTGVPTLLTVWRAGANTATLRAVASITGKSLVLDISCDTAVITSVTAGSWGPVLHSVAVPVPFYSGQVYYFSNENLFVNAFLDWTVSSASSFAGATARYDALTNGTRQLVRERAVFAPGWQIAEVLPNIPNPPSPYLADVSGRLVLDVWGGMFAAIAQNLRQLADYGVTRATAIIHDWQRSGYDNALPSHYPAQAQLGGDAGMEDLVSTGTGLGYRMALHENYVDYYPNYDYFSANDISLDSSGQLVKAWFNPGTLIQSFSERPDSMVRLASTQSPAIHQRYGTNAGYLDVNSAVAPWKNIDHRAGVQNPAMFQQFFFHAPELWQYERDTHQGPIFGEGNNHWYWSGLLDGAEAQFGSGWPANQGLSAPLMVDFDLLKMHPLMASHGMGYYERWALATTPLTMAVFDQYRAQEVAYGHEPFLGANTWATIPLAWLEYYLLAPVARLYGTSRAATISYQVNGTWTDSTAAAKVQQWNRVRVEYSNGLTVTVNGASTPLVEAGLTLPQFGWVARSESLTAYTATLNGAIADFADSGDTVFANARSLQYWQTLMGAALPSVSAFKQTVAGTFQATYQWQVYDTLATDYTAFVHFVVTQADGTDQIIFQQDHALKQPTSTWVPGGTITDGSYTIKAPANLADGDYKWYTGLYLPSAGVRVPLVNGDSQNRVPLGVLHVGQGGQAITYTADQTAQQTIQLHSLDLNNPGAVINFGPVSTDGSVVIRNEGGEWVMQTMPRNRAFTVMLDARRFALPDAVSCDGGTAVTPRRVGDTWWQIPLNGARAYRWRAPEGRPRRRAQSIVGSAQWAVGSGQ